MAQDETRQGIAQHRDMTVYALLSEPERFKPSKKVPFLELYQLDKIEKGNTAMHR